MSWHKTFYTLSAISICLCHGCGCCSSKKKQPKDNTLKEQNDIVVWYQHKNTKNEGLNIVFIKGDVTKAAMVDPKTPPKDKTKNTKWYFDHSAVVNAANPSLQGGGGVDACIHKCFKELAKHTDKAKISDMAAHKDKYENDASNELKASETLVDTVTDIIPAVDYFHFEKIFHSISVQDKKLGRARQSVLYKRTYNNIFTLACENNIEYLFIPCLGTGEWGYPIEHATKEYAETTAKFLQDNDSKDISLKYIIFVFYPGTKECSQLKNYIDALTTACSNISCNLTEKKDLGSNTKFYIDTDQIQEYQKTIV